MAERQVRSWLKHLMPIPIVAFIVQAPEYPPLDQHSFVDEHKLEAKDREERVRFAGVGGPRLLVKQPRTLVPELVEDIEQL